jgi:hypothetical protein
MSHIDTTWEETLPGAPPATATVGERLRLALAVRKRSIRALHKALQGDELPGTSYAALHRYVKDKAQPPADFLAATARELRVRPEWLLLGEGPAFQETWEQEREHERRAVFEAGREAEQQARLAQAREREQRAELDEPWNYMTFTRNLPLGPEPMATHRLRAIRRFLRKLEDADLANPQRGFINVSSRLALLYAAGVFLVRVDEAFAAAARPSEEGDDYYRGGRGRDWLIEVLVDGTTPPESIVAWHDAALDLFGRRVRWLGARDEHSRDLGDDARDDETEDLSL